MEGVEAVIGRARISINRLKVGEIYTIEVPRVTAVRHALIAAGKLAKCGGKKFSGITVGRYLGYTVETIENEDPGDIENDEDEDEDPYGDEGSDWSKIYFSIHNFFGPIDDNYDGPHDKNVHLLGEVTFLQFIRPSNFDPWHRNVLLENVTSWQKSRKWRSSRCHQIDIPREIAIEDMVFYKRVDNVERALCCIFQHFYGFYNLDVVGEIISHMSPQQV